MGTHGLSCNDADSRVFIIFFQPFLLQKGSWVPTSPTHSMALRLHDQCAAKRGQVNGCNAGVAPSDAGAAPTDSGVVPIGIGAVPIDAGVVPVDVGMIPTDAGVMPLDVGVIPIDVRAAPMGAGVVSIGVRAIPRDVGVVPTDVGFVSIDVGAKPLDAGAVPTDVGAELCPWVQHSSTNPSLGRASTCTGADCRVGTGKSLHTGGSGSGCRCGAVRLCLEEGWWHWGTWPGLAARGHGAGATGSRQGDFFPSP